MQAVTKGGQTILVYIVGYDGFCGVRIVYWLKRNGRGLRQREFWLDRRAGVVATVAQAETLCAWLKRRITTLSLLGVVHLTEDRVAKDTGIAVYIPSLTSRWERNVSETC